MVALLLLSVPAVAQQDAPLTPSQQSQVARIGAGLRCPICRDTLPITESGNEVSKQMLSEVTKQARQGKSDEEIYRFFTSRYGERIRLNPERSGTNLLLWGLPLLALLGGGAWLAGYLRGPRLAPQAADLPSDLPDDLPQPPDPYLAEVRAQVAQKQAQQQTRGQEQTP